MPLAVTVPPSGVSAPKRIFPRGCIPQWDQAADSKNFALVQFQIHIFQRRAPANSLCFQRDLRREAAVIITAIIVALQLSADHTCANLVRVKFRLVKVSDDSAVPQNRQSVADLHNFVQIMGDEENRFSLSR